MVARLNSSGKKTAALVLLGAVLFFSGVNIGETEEATPTLPQQQKSFNDEKTQTYQSDMATRIISAITACQNNSIAADRLLCYDTLATGIENKAFFKTPEKIGKEEAVGDKAAAQATQNTQANNNWHIQKSASGNAAAGVSSIFSEGDNPDWRHMRWALFIRCRTGEYDIYLESEKKIFHVETPIDVSAHIDGGKEILLPWEASVGGTAIGLWGNDRSAELLKALAHQRHVSFRVTMPAGGNVFASFDLLGIEPAMASLGDKCHGQPY